MITFFILTARTQDCPLSYFFSGQRCAPCQANCICSRIYLCQGCIPGYTYDTTLTNCIRCPSAMASSSSSILYPACTSCCSQVYGTTFSCSQCDNSTGWARVINGICIAHLGCISIDSVDFSCKNCTSGYFSKDGFCSSCAIGCATCYTAQTCSTCSSGYFSNLASSGGLCSACSLGCYSCLSAISCTKCFQGFYLLGSSCSNCPANCLTCSSNSICLSCGITSGLVNNICKLCSQLTGCIACSGGSSLTCLSCSAGLYLQLGTCKSCSTKFGAGTAMCNSSSILRCSNDMGTLSQRYLLNKTCILNSNNCKQIGTDGKCISCFTGEEGQNYYTLIAGTCVQCANSIGCLTFSILKDVCQCTACLSGYNYANGVCSACRIVRCKVCLQSPNQCSNCIDGYGIYSGACSLCLIANCKNCDGGPTTCIQCASNYFLKNSNCLLCQTSCLSCVDKQNCLICSDFYNLVQGLCSPFTTNCQRVGLDGNCQQCAYGTYSADSGICRSCKVEDWQLDLCQGKCESWLLNSYLLTGIIIGLTFAM